MPLKVNCNILDSPYTVIVGKSGLELILSYASYNLQSLKISTEQNPLLLLHII